MAARGLVIDDLQLSIQCEPPGDVEDYIHRSGITGRAGKSGVAVMLYDPRKENFPGIDRESGVKFELMFAPQRADIAKAAVEKLTAISDVPISDGVISVFKDAAEELIYSSDLSATGLLAKALANAAGCAEIKSRSLQSSLENYVTIILECGRPLCSHSKAYGGLRSFVPEDKVDSIEGLSLTADSRGTVCYVSIDTVMGTPERIKDHIEKGNLDFSSLKFWLLDEADDILRMCIVYDAELILGKVQDKSQVQTLLFSATLPSWVKEEVLLQDQTCVTPNSEQSPLLLEDLIIEILSRLSVKTLIRFRAVCKTWKKVISSSCFKRQHFGHEGNRTDLLVCWKGVKFADQDYDPFTYVNSISLFPYERLENPLASVELGKGFFKEEIRINGVWGPCHGILCVSFNDNMIALWNPATRNFWPIPENPLKQSIDDAPISFWIDPLTNEFKVFAVLKGLFQVDFQVSRESVKPSFVVYTSCNNSWKELEVPFYPGDSAGSYQCSRYSVSNGIYYFYIYRNSVPIMFAYDIIKDIFEEIPMPKVVAFDQEIVLDLFGDSLALFVVENVNDVARTEIWVMKEKDSWTKVFNGGIHVDVDTPGYYNALGFWNEKEIFISRDLYDDLRTHELMIYDLVSGKAQKILVESSGFSISNFFPLSYKESLISIEINGDVLQGMVEFALGE